MQEDIVIYEIRELVGKKNIHDVRKLARALGINSPSNVKKGVLIDCIAAFAGGTLSPAPRTGRGAPAKSKDYDRELADTILKCRETRLASLCGETQFMGGAGHDVADVITEKEEEFNGILEQTNKFFIVKNLISSAGESVFVHKSFVEKFGLRCGDMISGFSVANGAGGARGISRISSVNGLLPDMLGERRNFEGLIPLYPDARVYAALSADDISGRMVDLFAPVGAGQRAFVVGPPQSGKTTLLKKLAVGLTRNQPDFISLVLLVDGLPEDVADFRREAGGSRIFCSAFDESAENHVRTAEIVTEYAKRQVEIGKNVLLFIDGLEGLVRACNSLNLPTKSGGASYTEVKKILSAARNTEGGGSLTIISTLSDGSENDAAFALYCDLITSANMRVSLSGKFAREGQFPAIDITGCFSGKRERFVGADEIGAAIKLCKTSENRLSHAELINLFKETADNGLIIEKYK